MKHRPTLLSINNYYYRRGGAETVFLHHNQLFEEIGWDVVPFSMSHAKNHDSPWEEYFIEKIEYGDSYSLGRKIVNAGKIIYSREARRKIDALVPVISPTIAHAHNIYHHISPAILSKLNSMGVPTVLTLHDLKIACPAYKMLQGGSVCERCKGGAIWNVAIHRCIKNSLVLSGIVLLESLVHKFLSSYDKVDRLVVPSRFYIDKFVEWGWPRKRFTYIPNFVDTTYLRPTNDAGKRFVYCGRLSSEKGVSTFVRAVAQARVSGCVIGEGPEAERLERMAVEMNADIEFMGYRSGEELHNIIRNSRATVLPSEWYENAPMTLLESYALGRPVIGARIGGIPELIREGDTGWTFASGNADELAQLLISVAKASNAAIDEMGRVARQWVEERFSAMNYRENILNLYRELGAGI